MNNMPGFFHNLLSGLRDLFFPPSCLNCQAPLNTGDHPLLCPACLDTVRLVRRPWCSCCGEVFSGEGGDHLCERCLATPPRFSKARALFVFAPPVVTLIHAFKYLGNRAALSSLLAMVSEDRLNKLDLGESDLVIPVPLHPKRLRQRGFNQAGLVARKLFPGSKISFSSLKRLRVTASQTGMDRRTRRRNVKNAFSVSDPSLVKGKKILLVDEVFTTGATVDECAKTLLATGARQVEVFTLCRTIRHQDDPFSRLPSKPSIG